MNEVKYMADGAEITLNEELIKKYLVKGKGVPLSKDLHNFMQLCKYKGLNPYLNDVYLIVQGSDDDGGASTAIVVGKDFLLQRAQSHPAYDGLESGIVVLPSGGNAPEYRSGGVSVIGEAIAGGWARVFRKDWEKPVFVSVALAEYAKPGKSRKSNWDKMPATMISKVAVAQALRMAFAAELRGMYTQEEISTPVSGDTEAASADLAAKLFNSAPEPAPADVIAAMEPAKPTPEEIRAVKEKLAPDPKPAQKPAAKPASKPAAKPASAAPEPGIPVQETINPKPAPDPVQATFKLGQTKGEFKGCKFRIAMIFDGKSEQGQIGIVGVRADQPFAEEIAAITDPQLELVAELKPLSEEAKRQVSLEGDLSNPRFSAYEKYWIMTAPQRKRGAA